MTVSTSERQVGPTVPDSEDNRKICFEQGKACVYEPEDEPGIIVTEWPNGVVDRHHLEGKTRIRHWPDGTTEHRREDDPVEYPVWPPPTVGRADVRTPTSRRCRSSPS